MRATKTATPACPNRVDLLEHEGQRRIEVLAGRLGATVEAYLQFKQARWSVNALRARTIAGQWRRLALVLLLPVSGIGDIQTTTQTMSANVSPNGKLSIPDSINLQSPDTRFGALAGSLTVSYWARTSASGGGSVTVQANSDFSPAGGPSISAVTFTCSGATLGAGCSGSQALATSIQTSLVSLPGTACTGGGGACSGQEPNTVLLTFSVLSRPGYKTGTYSAQMTVTISTM